MLFVLINAITGKAELKDPRDRHKTDTVITDETTNLIENKNKEISDNITDKPKPLLRRRSSVVEEFEKLTSNSQHGTVLNSHNSDNRV